MSKVRYIDTQTYPLVSGATVTAGNFVKLTSGYVEKVTNSMSQDIIGYATVTVTDNSTITGTTDYVPVVRAGRIAVTGIVEGSGGTYKTAIAIGDTVSIYVTGGVQYLVTGGSAPIGKVRYGSVASSGTTADTTGTIEIDLNVEMESIKGTEIEFPLTIPTATATYCMDLNAGTFTTADFRLQNGATIANLTAGALTFTETAINMTTPTFTVGTSGTDVVIFSAKLGSQLYHNLSDQAYTVLKIHNHNNTAEIAGGEFKGEFKNATGDCIGTANYWSWEPTATTGTPNLSAGVNVVAVGTGMTMTSGNMYALSGEAQLHGTMDGAATNVAGVIGILSGVGANTQVLHMAGVQSAVTVTNPTTGTLSHFLANTVGTGVIDNLLCMQASQYITNFASFNLAAADKCIEASVATPASNTTHVIRVLVAGTEHYIPVYAAKTC